MKKVLIVDDAAFMRLTIKAILERNGFEIAGEAENGDIGIKRYKELKPDIVTMDITMPIKDGIQALKEIIAFDPDARIIMLSAVGQKPFICEAVLYGAKSFIIKPFSEEHLVKVLSQVLAI
ncbi:MAG: response regulator [Clostridiaceae bacterium]|jgi:two-component system chemotaxis response regulator CheY|nr:response regulator [Clostridiaceae bacterium]